MLGVCELDSTGSLVRDQWSTVVDMAVKLHKFMQGAEGWIIDYVNNNHLFMMNCLLDLVGLEQLQVVRLDGL
jgi:hypothetical protein